MDMESFVPLGIIVVIAVGVLLVSMWSRIVGNSPSRSQRAREMSELATRLGLNYVADANTLSERLWKHDRKFNLIEGERKGRQIEIYDYQTTTKHNFAPFGQDPLQGTCVGEIQYKDLSVKQLEALVLGEEVINRMNPKPKIGSRFGILVYSFLIVVVFLILIKLYLSGIL